MNHFDPWSPAFVANPYPAYEELRAEAAVSWFEPTGQYLWPATRTSTRCCATAGSAAPTCTSPPTRRWAGRTIRTTSRRSGTSSATACSIASRPDHTRLRRLVSQVFTARRVEGLRPTVQRLADDLVDAFVAKGGGDLIAEVAEPLPVTVIAELLGVPDADRPMLRPWSADICGMYELNPTRETADTAVRACVEFSDYLRGLARHAQGRSARRPHQRARRRRRALRGRADRHLRPAAQRRARGDAST